MFCLYLLILDFFSFLHFSRFLFALKFCLVSIEPQLYALRWLRLLMGREFELEDLLQLWDALFAHSAGTISSIVVSNH